MGMRRQQLRWTNVAEDHMKEAREHGRSPEAKTVRMKECQGFWKRSKDYGFKWLRTEATPAEPLSLRTIQTAARCIASLRHRQRDESKCRSMTDRQKRRAYFVTSWTAR